MTEEVFATVEDEVIKKLTDCSDFLLSCEANKLECEDCGRAAKRDCLIFIRSVVASLCNIELTRMGASDKEVPAQMYI